MTRRALSALLPLGFVLAVWAGSDLSGSAGGTAPGTGTPWSPASAPAVAQGPRILVDDLTMSDSLVAFVRDGALWVVPREGGEVRRVPVPGRVSAAAFSPATGALAYSVDFGPRDDDVYLLRRLDAEPLALLRQRLGY